jgi:hypothetical protein
LLGGKEMANFMARVPLNADFRSRSSYSFYTKQGWQPTYSKLDDLEPVLGDQAQGSLLKLSYTSGFAPFKKPYMWLGCNRWLDSKMWIAVSERIEGPYQFEFLGMAPEVMGKNSGHRYCLYPHLWGSNLTQGDLLISWSDDGVMGGKVACAMLTLKMDRLGEEQARELQRLQDEEDRKSKAEPVASAEAKQQTQEMQQSFAGLSVNDGSSDSSKGAGSSDLNVLSSPSQNFQPQNDTNTTGQQDAAKKEKHPHLHGFKDKLKGFVKEHKH